MPRVYRVTRVPVYWPDDEKYRLKRTVLLGVVGRAMEGVAAVVAGVAVAVAGAASSVVVYPSSVSRGHEAVVVELVTLVVLGGAYYVKAWLRESGDPW